jgi:hypothetical protein
MDVWEVSYGDNNGRLDKKRPGLLRGKSVFDHLQLLTSTIAFNGRYSSRFCSLRETLAADGEGREGLPPSCPKEPELVTRTKDMPFQHRYRVSHEAELFCDPNTGWFKDAAWQ